MDKDQLCICIPCHNLKPALSTVCGVTPRHVRPANVLPQLRKPRLPRKSNFGLSHLQLVVSRFSEVYAVRADTSPAGEETFGEKQWE